MRQSNLKMSSTGTTKKRKYSTRYGMKLNFGNIQMGTTKGKSKNKKIKVGLPIQDQTRKFGRGGRGGATSSRMALRDPELELLGDEMSGISIVDEWKRQRRQERDRLRTNDLREEWEKLFEDQFDAFIERLVVKSDQTDSTMCIDCGRERKDQDHPNRFHLMTTSTKIEVITIAVSTAQTLPWGTLPPGE
ncbi:MAG: hypothetical protein GY795_20635 [Desulfobacterales bacterium]|nr:hypothetical protein [Desulfobacterales bacterium]